MVMYLMDHLKIMRDSKENIDTEMVIYMKEHGRMM